MINKVFFTVLSASWLDIEAVYLVAQKHTACVLTRDNTGHLQAIVSMKSFAIPGHFERHLVS
jgi:hypothetical protein